MAVVMIGVDPHKASHTAVAISAAEEPLGELRVRACVAQAERLLAWAAAWPQRTWAIEGAGGLGHLLAQQLLAAGERVAMCRPSWARGSGCWRPGTQIRTTRTMPGRWPSRRCGRPVSGRPGRMITRRC
jgi:hypothetical protein